LLGLKTIIGKEFENFVIDLSPELRQIFARHKNDPLSIRPAYIKVEAPYDSPSFAADPFSNVSAQRRFPDKRLKRSSCPDNDKVSNALLKAVAWSRASF
tara:strand:- start:153 stop:449 length:297 start_codon:yes stop_codon:yes gene_type:complete